MTWGLPSKDGWYTDFSDSVGCIERKKYQFRDDEVSVCVYAYRGKWQTDYTEANGDTDGYLCPTEDHAIKQAEINLSDMINELLEMEELDGLVYVQGEPIGEWADYGMFGWDDVWGHRLPI